MARAHQVILAELEPVIEALLEPIRRLFDALECSAPVPAASLVLKLRRETLCDYVNGIDVAMRAEQFRARQLVARRDGAGSDVLRAFVGTLALETEAKVGGDARMRTAVLQQVARMETLGFSSAADD